MDNGITSVNVDLKMSNKVWYVEKNRSSQIYYAAIVHGYNTKHTAAIYSARQNNLYTLWHHILGHIGEKVKTDAIKTTAGMPTICSKYKNPIFRYPCYQDIKMTKIVKGYTSHHLNLKSGNRFLVYF